MSLNAFSTKHLKSQITFAHWITPFKLRNRLARRFKHHWREFLSWNSLHSESFVLVVIGQVSTGATTQSAQHCFTSYIFLPLLTSRWTSSTSSYQILSESHRNNDVGMIYGFLSISFVFCDLHNRGLLLGNGGAFIRVDHDIQRTR